MKLPQFQILEQPSSWHLQGVENLWPISKGEDITVFVLDSGLPNHPDLQNSIVHSVNCVSDETIDDTIGHSTAVCGIIKAIAPQAKIVIVKILNKNGSTDLFSSMKAFGYASTAANALEEYFPDLIVYSAGGQEKLPDILYTQIKNIHSRGVPIICAAGNSAYDGINYPAAYPECFAIGSHSKNKEVSRFSARGQQLDFSAPGSDVYTTWLNGEYKSLSGTSFAAPYAAGVLALMLSRYKKENNGMPIPTVDEIKRYFASICDDWGHKGHDSEYGFGIINLSKIAEASPNALPELPPESKPRPPTLFGFIAKFFKKL